MRKPTNEHAYDFTFSVRLDKEMIKRARKHSLNVAEIMRRALRHEITWAEAFIKNPTAKRIVHRK